MSCAFLLFSTKIVFYQIFLRLILFSFTWSTSSKKIRCLIEKHWKSKLFLYYYHTAFLQGDVYETDGPQQAGSILQTTVQTTVRSLGRTVSCSAVEAEGSRRGSAHQWKTNNGKVTTASRRENRRQINSRFYFQPENIWGRKSSMEPSEGFGNRGFTLVTACKCLAQPDPDGSWQPVQDRSSRGIILCRFTFILVFFLIASYIILQSISFYWSEVAGVCWMKPSLWWPQPRASRLRAGFAFIRTVRSWRSLPGGLGFPLQHAARSLASSQNQMP